MKNSGKLLIIILSVVFVLYLRVMMCNPLSFGDEGYHMSIAKQIYENKEYPRYVEFESTLSQKANYSSPPLFHFVLAGLFTIFGFNETVVKIFIPFVAVFGVGFLVYHFGKKAFNEETAFLSSIILVTTPAFVTYSVLVYRDILFMFFYAGFILSLIIFSKFSNTKTRKFRSARCKYIVLIGIFAGLSILTRRFGYTIFPIIILTMIYDVIRTKKADMKMKTVARYFLIMYLAFLIASPYIIKTINTYGNIGLPTNLEKITFDIQRNPNSGTEQSLSSYGVLNCLSFVYGSPLIPLFFIFAIFTWSLKDKRFIILLISFIVFIPILYMTQVKVESMVRYTLGALVSIVFIASLGIKNMTNNIYDTSNWKIIFMIFILIICFSNLILKLASMQVAKNIPEEFIESCEWIKNNTKEDAIIFTVWGHKTAYLSQRTVSKYYGLDGWEGLVFSNDIKTAMSVIEKHGITHIFIQKPSIHEGKYMETYPTEFVEFLENNPDYFRKIFENYGQYGNIVYEVIK